MNVPGKALKFTFFMIFLETFQFRMFPVFPQDGMVVPYKYYQKVAEVSGNPP